MRVKQVEFPDDVRNAVYQQMREERARVAAQRRAEGRQTAEEMTSTADKERTIILADAYRDGQTLRGEGDALSADIYATAYNQDPGVLRFLPKYRCISQVDGPSPAIFWSSVRITSSSAISINPVANSK